MTLNTQALVKSIVVLTIFGAALVLAQIWLNLFETVVFVKLLVTLLIVGGVVTFIIAVKSDMSDEKKLKDDKYLD